MEEVYQKDKMFELVTMEEDLSWLPEKTICKEFIREKCIKISKKKPKTEQLAKIIIKPVITSHKIVKTKRRTKVLFQGKIIEKVFYVADKPEQPVHAAHFSFLFCNFIKLPRKRAKIEDIKVNIEDVIVQLTKKRKINQCILIEVCVIPDSDYCISDC